MPIFNNDPIESSTENALPAVFGESKNTTVEAGPGIKGMGHGVGVLGEGRTWHGVAGLTHSTTGGYGVYGKSLSGGTGVAGESDGWIGVYGASKSSIGGAGVMGVGDPAPGVIGTSTHWIGVYGETQGVENGPAGIWGEHKGDGIGVKAVSHGGTGLVAFSQGGDAIHTSTKSDRAAIAAFNENYDGGGFGIFAKKSGSQGFAGFFEGRVWIGGDTGIGGSLTVGGLDIVAALRDLQQQFDALLASQRNPRSITVEQIGHASQGEVRVRVSGGGFRKNGATITIEWSGEAPGTHVLNADNQGKFASSIFPLRGFAGREVDFRAVDRDAPDGPESSDWFGLRVQ